jgi:hypothetical protein
MRSSVPKIDPRNIGHGPPVHGESLAREIVAGAIRRYFIARRSRIPAFVVRNFGWKGALSLHRKAFGNDLWRAPLNAALVAPAVAIKGIAYAFEKAGRRETARWLMSREIFLDTNVAREIDFRLHDELFELPYANGGRVVAKDALAGLILADPRTKAALAALNGPWGEAERRRLDARLREALAIYMQSRIAVSEIANVGLTLRHRRGARRQRRLRRRVRHRHRPDPGEARHPPAPPRLIGRFARSRLPRPPRPRLCRARAIRRPAGRAF